MHAAGGYSQGRLGIGTVSSDQGTPAHVASLADVTFAAAGFSHSLFILGNGDAYTVGDNRFGQLGSGSTDASVWTPVHVGSLSDVASVAGGAYYSLFALSVRCSLRVI